MVNIFWFRRDLRLEDNTGLYHALTDGSPVLPVFIFDEEILQKLENHADARVTFIYDEIARLKNQLEKHGSSLLVKCGKPENVFRELMNNYTIKTVFANHDYEPYARERDACVENLLNKHQIGFRTFKDQVILEKDEVVKDSGDPYTVFTPYSRKWKSIFSSMEIKDHPSQNPNLNYLRSDPFVLPDLSSIGFERAEVNIPERDIDIEIIRNYHHTRDFPAMKGHIQVGYTSQVRDHQHS